MSGWMSTAGEREWSIVNVEDETRTAAREKISQEELIVTKGLMKGENNLHVCSNKFKNLFAFHIHKEGDDINFNDTEFYCHCC